MGSLPGPAPWHTVVLRDRRGCAVAAVPVATDPRSPGRRRRIAGGGGVRSRLRNGRRRHALPGCLFEGVSDLDQLRLAALRADEPDPKGCGFGVEAGWVGL